MVISAPFGVYLGEGWATRTLGTFTRHARPPGTPEFPARGGRWWRVLRTVRYNPFTRGWRNKIGLRNPGLGSLYDPEAVDQQTFSDKIISVHGFTQAEWSELAFGAYRLLPLAVELNLSCPNVADAVHPRDALKNFFGAWGVPIKPIIIAKVPPMGHGLAEVLEIAWDIGVRHFHCCNTLPSPKGGISGKPLLPVALESVEFLREKYPEASIIGGGGITSMKDAREFLKRGADHVAVASCLFFPWNILRMKRIARRLEESES